MNTPFVGINRSRESLQSICKEQAITIGLLKAKLKQQEIVIKANEQVIKEIIHSYHRED